MNLSIALQIGSIESLFQLMIGKFDFPAMQAAQPILGPLIFFLYIIIVFTILVSMFMTIIMKAYEKAQHNVEEQSTDYKVVDFMIARFRSFIGL